VFCFDGTWNRLAVECPTNVVLLAQMVSPVTANGTAQVVYYDEGIGTDSRLNRWTGGIFGDGMLTIMREAYRFLIFNYNPGDELFVFGFSRGAYTARSFIGLVRHAGILDAASATKIDKAFEIYRHSPAGAGVESSAGLVFRAKHCTGACVSEADRVYRQREVPDFDAAKVPILDIRYLGAWDTVRALGIPDFLPGAQWFNRKYSFHDAVISSKIRSARHAVALDERRATFRPTLLGRTRVEDLNHLAEARAGKRFAEWICPYQERWFPGVHGEVGGGSSHRGLSDGALDWILSGARKQGLEVRDEEVGQVIRINPDPYESLRKEAARTFGRLDPVKWLKELFHADRSGPAGLSELHRSALLRWFADPAKFGGLKPYRPGSLNAARSAIDNWSCAPSNMKLEQCYDYAVMKGDIFSTISQKTLGDAKRWAEIFELNRDRIDDPECLSVGQKLRIPTL
jgi:uncharacterized protein (DUF2235 family)